MCRLYPNIKSFWIFLLKFMYFRKNTKIIIGFFYNNWYNVVYQIMGVFYTIKKENL